MGNGILAQAQSRLPQNMGGSQGARRDVPASFQGGSGQSLGVFQPPKKGGGGGGGGRIKLPKKKLPAVLKKEWEEQVAALKDAVKKGYISKEDAVALEAEAKVLYKELADKWGRPNEYSQALRDAASKYGSNSTLGISTGTILEGIVDYNVAKAISEGRAPAGAKLPGDPRNYQTVEQVDQARSDALQNALAKGQWDRAAELGATDTQIINAGGEFRGTTIIQEGPEQYEKDVWGGEPNGTVKATDGSSTTTGTEDSFSSSSFDVEDEYGADGEFAGLDDSQYETSVDDDPFESTDYDYDDFSSDGYNYDYDEGSSFEAAADSYGDSPTGEFNRGGFINYKGSGGMPAQRGNPNFPGKPMGTDTVPLYAEEGEFVMTREATDKFRPQLEAMNRHKPPSGTIDGAMSQMDDLINQYAQGGKV